MSTITTYTFTNKRTGEVCTVQAASKEAALAYLMDCLPSWKRRHIRLAHPFTARADGPAFARKDGE